LDRPIKKTDEATQNTEEDLTQKVSLSSLVLLGNRACLTKKLDDGYNQAPKADTAKAVGH
jgi:hypothetical protein